MKAAFQSSFGSPDVLSVQEVERPTVGDKDLLVRVHASPVTQGDRRLRSADFPGFMGPIGRLMFGVFRPKYPVPGSMFAGRVVAVGKNVTRFAVGDDVFGSAMSGAQAEYIAVPAEGPVARMPEGIDYEEAAAVSYGAGTALTFLRDMGGIKSGDKVLIIGASGGVGRYAVQLALHHGAEVTGVVGRNLDAARKLGAKHLIDYRHEDFADKGERYDLILDTSNTATFGHARRALTHNGRFLSLNLTLLLVFQMLRTRLLGGPRALGGVSMADAAQFEELSTLLGSGAIRPIIDRRFPLDSIAEAHRYLESTHPAGDIVMQVVAGSSRSQLAAPTP